MNEDEVNEMKRMRLKCMNENECINNRPNVSN